MLQLSILLSFFSLLNGQVLFPSTFKGSYLHGFLENSLEYFLISCPICEQSAISLSISVGSSQGQVAGLSHLLEHMVFLSSKTFPQEDYLMEFISKNAGYINAYTDLEHTNFYYSLSNKALKPSLDIFSRAFVEAIFTDENIERETQAVDSEHLKNKYVDDWRKFRLLQIAAGNKSFGLFNTGNLKTLGVKMIREMLEEHYLEYYVGENMKLVVYADYEIEEIKEFVVECFSDIRKGKRNEREMEEFEYKNEIFYYPQLSEGISLEAIFKVPAECYDAYEQPGHFIAYLLNNQGPNGISSEFSNIQNFQSEMLADLHGFSLISLKFSLYSEPNYMKIINSVFASLQKIRKVSENELKAAWQDYQTISKLHFDYSDLARPEDLAAIISANMLYLPEKFFYSGYDIKTSFEYQKIQKVLEIMLNREFVVIMSSSNFENGDKIGDIELNFDEYCEFYDMHYQHLPVFIYMDSVSSFEIYPKNHFIPDFLVREPIVNNSIFSIENQENFEIWCKLTDSFNNFKAMVTLLLKPENWINLQVKLDLIKSMAELQINKDLYLYQISGYSFELSLDYQGLALMVSGYKTNLLAYLEDILHILLNPDPSFFTNAWNVLYEDYSYFQFEQPYLQAEEYLKQISISDYVSISRKLEILLSLGYESNSIDLKTIRFSIKALILGELDKPERILQVLQKIRISESSDIASIKVPASGIFQYESTENHCLYVYYNFQDLSLRTWTSLLILGTLSNDLAFRVLRTQNQLGYIVYTEPSFKYFTNSLKIVIQGSVKNPEEMKDFVKRFWMKFEIDDKTFEETKMQVREKLMWKKRNLAEEFKEIWREIAIARYEFNMNERVAEIVEGVRKEEIQEIVRKIQEENAEVVIQIFKIEDEGLRENV